MYVGTAAGFGMLHPIFAQGFMTGMGARGMYSSATQDCSSKFAVARHGVRLSASRSRSPTSIAPQCLIIVGANPVDLEVELSAGLESRRKRLKEIERARRHASSSSIRAAPRPAKVAGEHVFIRPGTDVFFYLAFLHELLATGRRRPRRASRAS